MLIPGTTLIKNGSSFPPPRLFRAPRLFGREEYFKNGIEESYERVARIDKNMEVKEVAKTLIGQGGSYLRHQSHVANIKNTLPLMRELFNGKCIEIDFSESMAMKPKFEVQDAHFSGKQYSLHCSIVEPGIQKYFYHLSDDTTHDPEFVLKVLVDVFDKVSTKTSMLLIQCRYCQTIIISKS